MRCATETRLLRVPLRAQPSDAAVAVHPLVDFRFAFEAREVNRLDTRKLSQDIPVVLGNSHRFKNYFCFGHAPLWQRLDQQSKVPKVSQGVIEGIPVHDKPLFPIDMAYSRHMPSFTAEQATAARAFLGWSRHELGAASGLSFETVRDFEYDIQSATTKSVEAVRAPFHHAGFDFYRRGKRAGVTIVMPWQDDES